MTVVAAEDHGDEIGVLAGELGGDALKCGIEHFRIVHVGDEAVIGEAARREHLDVCGGKHDGLPDAKRPIELAHVAVSEDIASHDDGLEQFPDFFFACDTRLQVGHDVPFHSEHALTAAQFAENLPSDVGDKRRFGDMQLMGKAKGHDKAYKPTCDDVAECLEKGPGKRAYEGFECS